MIKNKKKHNAILISFLYLATFILIIIITIPKKNDTSNMGTLDFSQAEFSDSFNYPIGSYFVREPEKDYPGMDNYSLVCNIPNNQDEIYLCIPPIDLPIDLLINGKSVFSKTAKDCEKYARHSIVEYHLSPKEKTNSSYSTIELSLYYSSQKEIPYILTVSPFDNVNFRIGTINGIYNYLNKSLILDLTLFAACFISFIVYLFIFTYRHDNKNYLMYSLFSLTSALSLLVINQRIISFFFTDMRPQHAMLIMFIAYSFRTLFPYIYEKLNYPSYVRPRLAKIFLFSFIFSNMVGIFNPTVISKYIRKSLPVIGVIYTLVIIYNALHSYFKLNNTKSLVTIYTFPFLLINLICDALRQFSVYTIFFFSPVSLIIFITLQSIIMSRDYRVSVDNITNLSEKLKNAVNELQQNKSIYISSHIKPDYLYETLEKIDSYIDVDQEKVDSLIQNLSKYLRLTLDFTDSPKMHLLNDELTFCQAFIILVKEQHKEIKFTFDIDEKLPDVYIPKYSIQKLIDNSVSHAFLNTEHPKVLISVHVINERINISVQDNGSGFDNNMIQSVLSTPIITGEIGLYNINQILADTFNTNINIESIPNKATIISYEIPLVQAASQNLIIN